MPANPMQITYSLTAEDAARLTRVLGRRFRAQQARFSLPFGLHVLAWMCVGMAGASFVRLAQANADGSRGFIVVGALLTVALLAIAAQPLAARAAVRKFMVAPGGLFLAPQTVSMSDEFLRVSSSVAVTDFRWSGLLAREDDEHNHYLFVDRAQAIVLPRLAMAPLAQALEQHTAHLNAKAN